MAASELFKEFCAETTIHGVRYFAEQRRHFTERVFWISAFIISICLCGASIQSIWEKWIETPTVLGFPEKEVTVSEIPFPMVTVCPGTKSSKQKFDVTAAIHSLRQLKINLTDTELVKMRALTHVCPFPEFIDNFSFDFGDELTNESIYSIIQDIALSFNDTVKECAWKNQITECFELFSPVLTEGGLCFTYNALNSREVYTEQMAPNMLTLKTNPNITNWSLDDGYTHKRSRNNYPVRVFNAKPGDGLSFTVANHENDLEIMCQDHRALGFEIFLQLPGETIEMSRKRIRVPFLEGTDILVRPTYVRTSQRLRSYSVKQRQCFFPSDRRLRFFKMYTRQNCEAECLANFTLQECGCVKFSMPREIGVKICGTAKLECYHNAKKKLFGEEEIDGLDDEKARDFREKCDCLPSCTSISYNSDTERSTYDWEAYILAYNYSLEFLRFKPAFVQIYFKDIRLETFERSEMYTIANILSMWGGLLGLFMGVSVLSIAEFIYYSTFRLYWTFRERKRKRNNIVNSFIGQTIQTQPTKVYRLYGNRASQKRNS